MAKEGIQSIHISPFGVIPKKAKDTWRLIIDLSSPHGHSINDLIPQSWSSLSYVTVDMIADRIRELGPGTMLAKLDIRSAFRIVPVHPADCPLLGMQWKESLYVDTVLPFGLRSAPRLFNAIADAIQFIAIAKGVNHLVHYLDDFITLGRPASTECSSSCCRSASLCNMSVKITF